jgi:hypothetical protein
MHQSLIVLAFVALTLPAAGQDIPEWAEPKAHDTEATERSTERPKTPNVETQAPSRPGDPGDVPLGNLWVLVVFGGIYGIHKLRQD